jgi:hypothetical protein
MNMTKTNINSRVFSLIACTFVWLLVSSCHQSASKSKSDASIELQTFRTDDQGWGYQILVNNKVMVSQPIIPAIDSVMSFPTEESARKVGQLVLEKIINKENFAVSKQEVEYSLSY